VSLGRKSGQTLAKQQGDRPIVSSEHLSQGAMPALSEYEFGLMIAFNGFSRWIVRCMSAAGQPGLSALDVLVLHSVHHRAREKTLSDLSLVLNVDETHSIVYALKKLEARGLVKSGRRGKEKVVTITPKGAAACERYREYREELLVATAKRLAIDAEEVSRLAALLRGLSGTYDQAARAAAAA